LVQHVNSYGFSTCPVHTEFHVDLLLSLSIKMQKVKVVHKGVDCSEVDSVELGQEGKVI
jgi:hypothetical protein